jgi:hypothetical protein
LITSSTLQGSSPCAPTLISLGFPFVGLGTSNYIGNEISLRRLVTRSCNFGSPLGCQALSLEALSLGQFPTADDNGRAVRRPAAIPCRIRPTTMRLLNVGRPLDHGPGRPGMERGDTPAKSSATARHATGRESRYGFHLRAMGVISSTVVRWRPR